MSDEPGQQIVSRVRLIEDIELTPGGIQVVRSICNPAPEPDELGDVFTAYLAPVEDPPHPMFGVVGEVQTSNLQRTHMLGVTVVLFVSMNQQVPDLNDPEVYRTFAERVVPWSAHILWDMATTQLRLVASGLLHADMNITPVTPEPILLNVLGQEPIYPLEGRQEEHEQS